MNYYVAQAVPTVYRGQRYRSQHEAHWAAFFDLMGWSYTYEPFKLEGWWPDFLLWGVDPSKGLLVEVKPWQEWDRAVARKMADACERGGRYYPYLLLAREPECMVDGRNQIGWLGENGEYEACWSRLLVRPVNEFGFDLVAYGGARSGHGLIWGEYEGWLPVTTTLPSLWKQAIDRVRPKGAMA